MSISPSLQEFVIFLAYFIVSPETGRIDMLVSLIPPSVNNFGIRWVVVLSLHLVLRRVSQKRQFMTCIWFNDMGHVVKE